MATTYTNALGRRKTSVARVYLKPGTGAMTVNGKESNVYFPVPHLAIKLTQPFEITNTVGQYDVKVNVKGGGIKGQIEAIALGVSRALVKINEENKPTLKTEKLLTRDPRMVERKKFGRKKARKSFQFSKR
ncbi:MAG: 30S ribosomal protein S9 [Chitinophagales bacterium]|nr:30S ribosomal protein S9 [Chitinophagales bacterium]MCZ2393683.1 30S ribosomal protein S9 [Chitinophagales bacterium]